MKLAWVLSALMPVFSAAETRIPFIEGLTTVRVGSSPVGDYETLRTVANITDGGFTLQTVGKAPSDSGEGLIDVKLKRRVRAQDQLHSRVLRLIWHSDDRESMTGNVPGISCDLFRELRSRNRASLGMLAFGDRVAFVNTERKFSGDVRVVDRKPYPISVNREQVQLPALHLRGELRLDGEIRVLDMHVVDDPDNPMTLRAIFGDQEGRVTRIEFAPPAGSIAKQLMEQESLELSGIYFEFARADLLPASDAMLARLADVLLANPRWRFHVDGHTDSVGDGASNQALSQRRAEAVRQALIARGAASAALESRGFGEARPIESNDSVEGRARNRRVELVRMGAPLPGTAATAAPPVASSACVYKGKS